MFRQYYTTVKRYFELGANSPKWLFHLFFSAMLRSGTKLLIPFAAAEIVEYATNEDWQGAFIFAFVFLGVSVLYVMCHRYNFWAYKKNSIYVHNKLEQLLLDKVTTYDQDFSKTISTSKIIATSYNDLILIHMVPDTLFDIITQAIGIGIAIGVLFGVDVWVGLIALAFDILSIWEFARNVPKATYHLTKQREHQDDISGIMGQALDGSKEIHSFNMEEDLNKYLEEHKKRWRTDYFSKRRYYDREMVVPLAILGAAKMMIYLLLIYLVLQGRYDVATLVLAIGYFENIENESGDVYDTLDTLASKYTRVNRMWELLNYKTRNMLEFGADNTDDISGLVEFRHVSFEYEKQTTMKDVSFSVDPCSFTAIVGKSGSGKSTIFRLLLRLYKTSSGEILLDGKNIYDYAPEVYASNVAIVTQKPFIFDMSIRENLSLVDKNFEHQVEACKRAGVHDFIMSLPDGYNTKLTHDAENISTGQKQLIALARTLLSRAEVLLFDEVTSSLDLATSKQIMGILKDLKKDHTILMITHKPQLMKIADEIMVIDRGRLVGRGTHKELMAKNKYYRILQK